MNVVCHSVDDDRDTFEFFDEATHVSEEFVHYFGRDLWEMTLGAKNDMSE